MTPKEGLRQFHLVLEKKHVSGADLAEACGALETCLKKARQRSALSRIALSLAIFGAVALAAYVLRNGGFFLNSYLRGYIAAYTDFCPLRENARETAELASLPMKQYMPGGSYWGQKAWDRGLTDGAKDCGYNQGYHTYEDGADNSLPRIYIKNWLKGLDDAREQGREDE